MDTAHPTTKRLRVLLVPDFTQWILGTMAKAIADFNPWIQATVCSEGVLRDQLPHLPSIQERIDLVHFLREEPFNKAGHLFFDRLPCVTSVHHIDTWDVTGPATAADAILYVSNQWRDELVKQGVPPDRLSYLPNGIYAEHFKPADSAEKRRLQSKLGIASGSLVVGFIAKRSSNTADRKGSDIFSQAIKALHKHVPEVVPLIVGPGWQDFVRELRQDGIQAVWLPFVADFREFARAYQCMDLYWVTSRLEGGPVPLIEAMGSGVCCVSTPVGMARDIIKDGENACLSPIGDADQLVARSLALIRDVPARRRMAQAARQTILDGFQWSQTAQRAGSLYALALRRFAQRTNTPVRQDLIDVIESPHAPVTDTPKLHLSAIPAPYRAKIRAVEQVHWMHHLAGMGQIGPALRYGFKACLTPPITGYGCWRVGRAAAAMMLHRQ